MIYGGMRLGSCIKLAENVHLPVAIKAAVQNEYTAFHSSFIRMIVLGIGLCALSPVPLLSFLAADSGLDAYGAAALLFWWPAARSSSSAAGYCMTATGGCSNRRL